MLFQQKIFLFKIFISYMAKKIREVRLVRGSLLIVLFKTIKHLSLNPSNFP